MTRLDWSRVKGRWRSVPVIVLDDDRMMPIVTAGGDRAGDDRVSVVTAPMMALAMVVEGDLPVVPVIKASAFIVDDDSLVMVMAMGPNEQSWVLHVMIETPCHQFGKRLATALSKPKAGLPANPIGAPAEWKQAFPRNCFASKTG